ncbi:hypothetical protein ACXZ1K_01920 [Pedobacter sp. PWIIR3]
MKKAPLMLLKPWRSKAYKHWVNAYRRKIQEGLNGRKGQWNLES